MMCACVVTECLQFAGERWGKCTGSQVELPTKKGLLIRACVKKAKDFSGLPAPPAVACGQFPHWKLLNTRMIPSFKEYVAQRELLDYTDRGGELCCAAEGSNIGRSIR